MRSLDGIDATFLVALKGLAGAPDEIEFERRGSGDSTYPFHGQIVSVNDETGVIHIRRTRSSSGQVHEMGLRYFLSATLPSGEKLSNRVVAERDAAYRAKHKLRLQALAQAHKLPRSTPRGERHCFSQGKGVGTLEGFPSERYLFRDVLGSGRQIGILAKSQAAAMHFMALQDLFVPLDDMVWQAIDNRVLWPAGIAFDRQQVPDSWAVDWFLLFDELEGIPPAVLTSYLDAIRSGREFFHSKLPGDAVLLVEAGLLEVEPEPTTVPGILDRVPIAGIRQLLAQAGSSVKAQRKTELIEALTPLMTAEMIQLAKGKMQPPPCRIRVPAGLSYETFNQAVKELRESIFLMRQWVRATRELYREEDLTQLASVA